MGMLLQTESGICSVLWVKERFDCFDPFPHLRKFIQHMSSYTTCRCVFKSSLFYVFPYMYLKSCSLIHFPFSKVSEGSGETVESPLLTSLCYSDAINFCNNDTKYV